MTQVRCYVCRLFFDKKKRECPGCATPQRPYNEAVISARWASNLNAHAAHADKHT